MPASATATIVQPPGVRRRDQPADRAEDDQAGEDEQRRAVRLGREHLHPPQPEGDVSPRRAAGRAASRTARAGARPRRSACARRPRGARASRRGCPATISTTMKATISASPIVRRRASASSSIRVRVASVAVSSTHARVPSVVAGVGSRRRRLVRRRLVARVRRHLAAGRAEEAAAERQRSRGAAGRARCRLGAGDPRRSIRPLLVLAARWSWLGSPRSWCRGCRDRGRARARAQPRSERNSVRTMRADDPRRPQRPRPARVWQASGRSTSTSPRPPSVGLAGGFFALGVRSAAGRAARGAALRAAALRAARSRDEARAAVEGSWPRSKALDVTIVRRAVGHRPGRVNAIMHLEGAEPLAPDLSDLDDVVRARAPLDRDHLVAAERLRRGRAVPFPVLARHRRRADRGRAATSSTPATCSGILVDLSHLNEAGFWDVARITPGAARRHPLERPRALRLSRNLTDRQLDAIGESGGIVGVNFARRVPARATGATTRPRPSPRSCATSTTSRAGSGSTTSRSAPTSRAPSCPPSSAGSPGCRALVEALRAAGYDDEALAKITHGNWLRVLERDLAALVALLPARRASMPAPTLLDALDRFRRPGSRSTSAPAPAATRSSCCAAAGA